MQATLLSVPEAQHTQLTPMHASDPWHPSNDVHDRVGAVYAVQQLIDVPVRFSPFLMFPGTHSGLYSSAAYVSISISLAKR